MGDEKRGWAHASIVTIFDSTSLVNGRLQALQKVDQNQNTSDFPSRTKTNGPGTYWGEGLRF